MKSLWSATVLTAALVLTSVRGAHAQPPPLAAIEQGSEEGRLRPFEALDAARVPSGLLLDKALQFEDPAAHDGSRQSRPATLESWRQLYLQLTRGAMRVDATARLPSLDEVGRRAAKHLEQGVVPLAVVDATYHRLKPDALSRGLLKQREGRLHDVPGVAESPYAEGRLFAVTALRPRADGRSVRFVVAPELYLGNRAGRGQRLRVDLDDGRGFQSVVPGQVLAAEYTRGGQKTLRVIAEDQALASTTLFISPFPIPWPDLSWHDQQAARPYAGAHAKYDAHVYLGAGNTTLRKPVVFVEGFDPYAWDPWRRRTLGDIYLLLAQQNIVGTLRTFGHDVVILKMHDASDYIQRNAFALESLLNQLRAQLPAGGSIAVVGASMGGLVARYALAFMEQQGLPHDVRLFVSLDTPHRGANIPLGDQEFFEFFNNDSAGADDGVKAVNSPAARQMLALHYKSPIESFQNPLRTTFVSELNALGYPQQPRRAAIANGSGHALAQQGNWRVNHARASPGDPLVYMRGRDWRADIDGYVWAVPDRTPRTQVFYGRKDVIGLHYRSLRLEVEGTLPYDTAPGGFRDTQQQMAGQARPDYVDTLYTSYPNHAFVPTVSALDLETSDLYYHVAHDWYGLVQELPDGTRATSRFSAIHFPADNEPHLAVTHDNATFLLRQIDSVIAGPMLPLSVTVTGTSLVYWPGEQGTWQVDVAHAKGPVSIEWLISYDGFSWAPLYAYGSTFSMQVWQNATLSASAASAGETASADFYVELYEEPCYDPNPHDYYDECS